jgi:hypothetical protein
MKNQLYLFDDGNNKLILKYEDYTDDNYIRCSIIKGVNPKGKQVASMNKTMPPLLWNKRYMKPFNNYNTFDRSTRMPKNLPRLKEDV